MKSIAQAEVASIGSAEILLGWLPGQVRRWRLGSEVSALAPALLYGDSVKVLCPHSDDALETEDYFDLMRGALAGRVEFIALDSGYALLEDDGAFVTEPDGHYRYGFLIPEVWEAYQERVLVSARAAIEAGDMSAAGWQIRKLSRAVNEEGDELLALTGAPALVRPALRAAVQEAGEGAEHEAHAELLAEVFAHESMRERRYPMIDDVSGALADVLSHRPSHPMTVQSAELALGVSLLGTLPSPAAVPWDVLAGVRAGLDDPLTRFRGAVARLSRTPTSEDQSEWVQSVWAADVAPALIEVEELVREASWRSVFFNDVAGDLRTYAGPVLALLSTTVANFSSAVSAVVGLGPAALSVASHKARLSKAARQHDFFYLRELDRRLQR